MVTNQIPNSIIPFDAQIHESQGDGWKIETHYGFIEYKHVYSTNTNEIWWVETRVRQKGHGSFLVDLMQYAHPAATIAWGVTTPEGKCLRDSWHRKHPDIDKVNGAHECQFDPSGDNYGEDVYDDPED